MSFFAIVQVEGWASLSKSGLKREMNEVRYKKLAAERQARMLTAPIVSKPAPDQGRKRLRGDDASDDDVGQTGAMGLLTSACQRKSNEYRALRAAWVTRAVASDVRVVVDCSFVREAYMGMRDQISLTSQLLQAYGAVRKHAAHPIHLIFTGVPDSMLARFGRVPGFPEWGLSCYREDYASVFSVKRSVCTGGLMASTSGDASVNATTHRDAIEAIALDARKGPDWSGIVARGFDDSSLIAWKGVPPVASSAPTTTSPRICVPLESSAECDGTCDLAVAPISCSSGALVPKEEDTEFAVRGAPPFPLASLDADSAWPPCSDALKPHLVYLSADSPNILTHLEPGTVYVVGGLIDRNRFKGITQR